MLLEELLVLLLFWLPSFLSDSLVPSLHHYNLSQDFIDVALVCDDARLSKAHKVVLAKYIWLSDLKIDFAHLVTKFLVNMIMFCVFMFVFTERGGGVVRTRPKKRLNPDELRSFNISMSKETKLLDVLKSSFSMIFMFLNCAWLDFFYLFAINAYQTIWCIISSAQYRGFPPPDVWIYKSKKHRKVPC